MWPCVEILCEKTKRIRLAPISCSDDSIVTKIFSNNYQGKVALEASQDFEAATRILLVAEGNRDRHHNLNHASIWGHFCEETSQLTKPF